MRLTLRTLLAYLDGNLEPEDAADIGKKIEESEFATKLVQAIRECVQRPRLGSPQLMGRGLGADPNTVAEYLEYRLGDERVPEFERICLESEVHLAEVASCHQILTLVLGEPAEIEPRARQRMYDLAAEVIAPPTQPDSMQQPVAAPVIATVASPQPPAPPVIRRAKPEVPEYLRESRTSVWPIVAAVLVAATATFAGLYFFSPQPLRDQVAALVGTAGEESAVTDQNPSAAQDAENPNDTAADEAASSDATVDPADTQPDTPAVADTAPSNEAMPADAADVADPTDPYADDATPLEPQPAARPQPDPSLALPAASTPTPVDPADAPLPPDPMPRTTARPAPLPGELPAADAMPAEPASDTPFPAPAATPAPVASDVGPRGAAPAEGFGRFSRSPGQVLLRFDPTVSEWLRISAGALLQKGDRLLSLPLFQPPITLSSNFIIQADGAASFEFVGWDEAGVPIVKVDFGRLFIDTIGRAGNSLRLQLDGHEPLITFVDSQSTLALEVVRELPPGKNPQTAPAPLVANVYATSGVIRVASQDAAPVEIQAPAVMPLLGAGAQPVAGEFPTWVNREVQSDADRGTSAEIEAYLTAQAPVGMQLRELNDPKHKQGRKRNVRSAAVRSLTYLDSFEPSIDALNDPDLRPYWADVRLELQQAIARSPETAARVQAAWIKRHGQTDGPALDRMLWGYTANDLNAGSGRDLIDALGRNDSLDFRVLGILALEELTGVKHGYRPEDKEFDRRISYNRWKNQEGKLVPRARGTSRPAATK